MSAITDDNQAFLRQVASNAFGSGWLEGKKGGAGNIGLLNGKVVKFNTHFGERDGVVSRQMEDSSNALRLKLYKIAETATKGGKSRQLETFRKMLGLELTDDGVDVNVKEKGLLDRTVAARFINKLAEVDGFDAWSDGEGGRVAAARTLKHSKFKDVRLENLSDPLRRQLREKADAFASQLIEGKKNEHGRPISGQTRELLATILLKCTAPHVLLKARLDADGNFKLADRQWENDPTFLLLKKSIDPNDYLSLSLANDLPPSKAIPFLKACAKLGMPGEIAGLPQRLHAIAGRLKDLSPEEFTRENIVKLVYPELKLTQDQKTRLRETNDMREFAFELRQLVMDAAGLDSMELQGWTGIGMQLGLSISDLRTLNTEPARFNKKMLPPGAFSFVVPIQADSKKGLDGVFTDLKHELDRYPLHVLFKGPDGDDSQPVGDPKVLKRQFEALCGKETGILMKTNVARFLCADAHTFDMMLAKCVMRQGAAFDPMISIAFERQNDGSVIGTRKCLLGSELQSEWKVRFHPDGRIETLDFGWRTLSETDKAAIFLKGRKHYSTDETRVFQEELSENKIRADLKKGSYNAPGDLHRGVFVHVGDNSYGRPQFDPKTTTEESRASALNELKGKIKEVANGDDALARIVLELSSQVLSSPDEMSHRGEGSFGGIGNNNSSGLKRTDFSYVPEKDSVRIRMDRTFAPALCSVNFGEKLIVLDQERSFIDSHVEVVVTKLPPNAVVEENERNELYEDHEGNTFQVKVDAARSYRVSQVFKANADKAKSLIGSQDN